MSVKKTLVPLLILSLTFSLLSCGKRVEDLKTPASAEVSVQTDDQDSKEPLSKTPDRSGTEDKVEETSGTAEVKKVESYSFQCGGIAVTPGDPCTEALFEETEPSIQTPDCRTNQLATVYYHQGFNIQTVCNQDALTGETDLPYISCIEVNGETSLPVEGISVGAKREEVLRKLGSGYEEAFGGWLYRDISGITTLSVYFSAETDLVQYLIYSLDESAFEESHALSEEEITELLGRSDSTDGDSGIRFENVRTRRELVGAPYHFDQENYDFVSDVMAFDKDGNELEVSYEIYCPTLTKDYNFGPEFIVFSATDAEGNRAVAYQSCFIEIWSEKDETVIERLLDELDGKSLQEIKNYFMVTYPFAQDYRALSPISEGDIWKSGNCYVHARMLYEVLIAQGYETQIVWDMTCRHYWVLVKTEDGWRHLDATPLPAYSTEESTMTDEERLLNHGGRPWDTSIWPAAN